MNKCLVMVCVGLLFSGCAEKSDQGQVVATVGNYEIPLYELTENFVQQSAREFPSAEEELKAKIEFLSGLVDQALLIKAAYAYGLETDIEVMEMVEQERDKFLLDELFRVEVIEKATVTEDEVQLWYTNWFTSVRARHIMVDDKNVADSIVGVLGDGGDFAAIARDVSKDPLTRRRGGDLGRVFRWGELSAAFQEVLFALEVDQVSQPVETEYGWHVIQLLEKTERAQLPLDSVRQSIEGRIKSIKQQAQQLAHRKGLIDKYPIELVATTVDFVRGKVAETPAPDSSTVPDSLRWIEQEGIFSELEREKPLGRYLGDRVLTLGEFLQASANLPRDTKPALDNSSGIKGIIFSAVLYEVLADQAKQLGLEDAELYQSRMNNFTESMMAEKMKNTILRRGISVTESDIKGYYDDHPEQFHTELRLRVREIQQPTKREAGALYLRLTEGASFKNLAGQHTTRQGFQANSGDLGVLKAYRYPRIYAVADTLKVGAVSRPFATEDAWSIITVTDREESKLQVFEEVKGNIFSDLRNGRIDSVYHAYIDSLKATTPITVDENMVMETIDRSRYDNILAPQGQDQDSL